MYKEIEDFSKSIGAKLLRNLMGRNNIFSFGENFLKVKISRSDKPLWGVGEKDIDNLNSIADVTGKTFFLVLLTSSKDGYVFSKKELNTNIEKGDWKLNYQDQYLINPSSLKHKNSFYSPENFLEKINDYLSVNPK